MWRRKNLLSKRPLSLNHTLGDLLRWLADPRRPGEGPWLDLDRKDIGFVELDAFGEGNFFWAISAAMRRKEMEKDAIETT